MAVDGDTDPPENPSGGGTNCGTTAISANVTLDTSAQNIVTSLGNCVTATGATDGFHVTLNYDMTGMKPFVDGDTAATITYAIAEDA